MSKNHMPNEITLGSFLQDAELHKGTGGSSHEASETIILQKENTKCPINPWHIQSGILSIISIGCIHVQWPITVNESIRSAQVILEHST